jgi:hypothetical protein
MTDIFEAPARDTSDPAAERSPVLMPVALGVALAVIRDRLAPAASQAEIVDVPAAA